MAPSFFKRVSARKGNKERKRQDDTNTPITGDTVGVKRTIIESGRQRETHHDDSMRRDPIRDKSAGRRHAALSHDDDYMGRTRSAENSTQKPKAGQRQKAKTKTKPAEAGGTSRSLQREQKENCPRSSNSRRERSDDVKNRRKSTRLTKDANVIPISKSRNSSQAVRAKHDTRKHETGNRRTDTARDTSKPSHKARDKGQSENSALQERGKDPMKPPVAQEHGKRTGKSAEHQTSSRNKKTEAAQKSLRTPQGAGTEKMVEKDDRDDKAVSSEEAASVFLLSAIEAFKAFKENDNQSKLIESQSSDDNSDSASSAKSYRRLMAAFDSYQSARDQEIPGGLDEKQKGDASHNIVMKHNDVLEQMQRALSVVDTQGTRKAVPHQGSQGKQHPNHPSMSSTSDKKQKKVNMPQHQLPRLKEHEESEWSDGDAAPLQRHCGHHRENSSSDIHHRDNSSSAIHLTGGGSARPRRLPLSYQDDDDTTIVTFGTEGESSVEVSCFPDDESTVVHLFNGDKYADANKNETGCTSGSQTGDRPKSGGTLQMELHSAWRGKGAGASPALKTVRFDQDGADVAWDLNFFPTQKLKEREMKKRDDIRKQDEEEEQKRRMELWEASKSKMVRPPPPGRRGRGMDAPRPPRPSTTLSVDSSMASSFNPSGAHSIAESSVTCSIRSGNTSSYASSYASSEFTDNDSEPMIRYLDESCGTSFMAS
mmetsp:Transcript_55987/g.167654  ORF Transcript_55987/g.167654 Transcript_55987/m.167654 type:complete len:709 (-) Transcript_55987:302-2428(-)